MRSGRTHAFAERFAPKKSAFKFISIVICLEEGAKCGRKRITIQELFENPDSDPSFHGRSPHGERGLKYLSNLSISGKIKFTPHTGSVD